MTDLKKLLAQNIKAYRSIRGLSQELLAEKAGASTTHIGMIETGKSFPSTRLLERIAEALGVDTPELFSREAARIIPVSHVSLEKLYQDIVHEFETIVATKIKELHMEQGS